MTKSIVLRPRMSEKAYAQSLRGVYVFTVPLNSNKHVVAEAVNAQFSVTVKGVNIVNTLGKSKQTFMKRGKKVFGKQIDQAKAYVTLQKGESIPIFAAAEKAEEKSEKLQKATEKAAAKVSKKEKK